MGDVPQVPLAPLPAKITVAPAQGLIDGKTVSFVQMFVSDPSGMKVVFLDHEFAAKIGQALLDHARQARNGLVVAKAIEGLDNPNSKGPRLVR